ncbi:hypothetical protein [Halobellus ordinarius]|uniref:PaaD-like zinc ribbon domain-containing protein n=1 Tax=Halobellus ordinarius TaxID=3075120 RepID=UPI00288097FA|nr:hypothetical protein [Halobellus sp. ZY16]
MSSNTTPDSDPDPTPEQAGEGPEENGTFRPACPFCGSEDVEKESTFGTEISKSQYYCNGCHTLFERIKYDGAMPDTGRDADGSR